VVERDGERVEAAEVMFFGGFAPSAPMTPVQYCSSQGWTGGSGNYLRGKWDLALYSKIASTTQLTSTV
jgi:hypothetical protein